MTYLDACVLHISGGGSWWLAALALIWAIRDIVLFVLIPRADRAGVLRARAKRGSKDVASVG